MDILISHAELGRRASTRVAADVLEAAIEQVFGYPVQIRGIEVWASPMLFEEGRVPERWLRIPGPLNTLMLHDGPLEVSALLGQTPLPLEPQRMTPRRREAGVVPSAAEMIRRRRERLKRERDPD